MYKEHFYITDPVGNNAFSYDERKNKKLYVPNLIDAKIEDVKLGGEVVFEDFAFDGTLQSCKGLKNFYHMRWKGKDLYLFDNHNHAYFFFYLARFQGVIQDNATLIHVDEHADTRDPGVYQTREDSSDIEKVFHFTNYVLNVGNYIVPAQKEGLVGDVIQIRNQTNLEEYWNLRLAEDKNIILNVDLDFFQPDLDYIDYNSKKKVVLDAAGKARVITVATSPFFINQELAIQVFQDIFG